MARRTPQAMAKRAREQSVKERRERKREKKAEAAAARAGADTPVVPGDMGAEDIAAPLSPTEPPHAAA